MAMSQKDKISLKDAMLYVSVRDGKDVRKHASYRDEVDGHDFLLLVYSHAPHVGMTNRGYRFTIFIDGKASVGGIIS